MQSLKFSQRWEINIFLGTYWACTHSSTWCGLLDSSNMSELFKAPYGHITQFFLLNFFGCPLGSPSWNTTSSICWLDNSYIVVQLLSPIWLFATPWTAARQASLSFTISQSLLKIMPIESVMPSITFISSSVTLFSSCPQYFPASGSFPMSWFFASGG